MTKTAILSVVSRVLLILAGIAVLVLGYWLIQTLLAPVVVPPPPPTPKNITFDSQLDVSKNITFTHLVPLGPADTSATDLGRSNPFLPAQAGTRIPVQVSSTTTTAPTGGTTTQLGL